MGRLNVSNGENITAKLNNTSDPVVPAGSYRIGGDVNFWGKTILFDGDVTLTVPGGLPINSKSGSAKFSGDGYVGFTESGGKLTIDQTAPQSACEVSLGGGGQFGDKNGTIVFRGTVDLKGRQERSNHPYILGVGGAGEMSFVNCHWPDGFMNPSNWGYLWTNTGADITFDGCYLRGAANNCIYASTMTGKLTVRNSYFEDNTVSAIRTGASGGTVVENTTFHFGSVVAKQWFTGGSAQRAIWCHSYNGGRNDVTLRNCNFIADGPAASAHIAGGAGGTFDIWLENTRFSQGAPVLSGGNLIQHGDILRNPDDPGGPVDGGSGGGGTEPETCFGEPSTAPMSDIVNLNAENTIAFCRQDRSDWSSYEFIVDGEILKVDVIGDDDQINGDTATGNVGSGLKATWAYTGNLTGLSAPGIDVELNGENVTGRLRELLSYYAENYGQDPGDDPTDPTEPTDPEDPIESGISWEIVGPLVLFAALNRKNR